MFPECISGVTPLAKAFHLCSSCRKLSRFRCQTEVVLTCARSCSSHLCLTARQVNPWLFTSQKTWILVLSRSPSSLKNLGVNCTCSSHLLYWCPMGFSSGCRCSGCLMLWDSLDVGQEHWIPVGLYSAAGVHNQWLDGQEKNGQSRWCSWRLITCSAPWGCTRSLAHPSSSPGCWAGHGKRLFWKVVAGGRSCMKELFIDTGSSLHMVTVRLAFMWLSQDTTNVSAQAQNLLRLYPKRPKKH